MSNGPSGSQEYVEFVVIDNTVAYDCSGSAPPCIDIRGWIFDDNSGYHGTSGQASGAVRFSQDPLWSCVPLGTIILMYNGLDPNISLPADDFSLTDGNCNLVLPLDNLTYFEFTATTPGDVACSYPTTGWGSDPSPTWSNVALANGGDCARIVDLNGCEVFSLCYGSCSSNPLIYFNGSGADDVWYFNDGDPAVQGNWTEGCAGDISACGSNDQTPGAPNNLANQNYIAQFNNNCLPITPLVGAGQITNLVCGCNSTAEVTASGSIGPYTFEWLDDNDNPIGQNTSIATNLCGGTYNAVSTSSIGCTDTVEIIIGNSSTVFAGNDATLTYCDLAGTVDLLNELGGTPDTGGAWDGPSALAGGDLGTFDPVSNGDGIYEYMVLGSGGCPNDTAFVTISSNISPFAGTGLVIDICESATTFNLQDSLIGSFDLNGTWNGSSVLTGGDLGTFNPASNSSGTYEYIVLGSGSCENDTAFVEVNISLSVDAGIGATIIACENDPLFDLFDQLTGSPSAGGIWQPNTATSNAVFDPAVDLDDVYEYIVSGNGVCPNDTASVDVTVESVPQVQITVGDVVCNGASDGSIDLTILPAGSQTTWTLPGGSTLIQEDLTGLDAGDYFYEVISATGCIDTTTITVSEPLALNLQLQVTDETCLNVCDGSVVASVINGANPFSYTFNGASTGSDEAINLCAGNVDVEVTDGNGCVATASSLVGTINSASEPTISGANQVCINSNGIALAADIAGGTWSGVGVDPVTGFFDPIVSGLGQFDIIYTVSGVCGGDDTLSIDVSDVPIIDIQLSDTSGCAPLSVNMVNLNASADDISCIWTISDGTVVNDCGLYSHVFGGSGCYDVSLEVTNAGGCSASAISQSQVCVSEQPDASFTTNSTAFTNLNPGLTATAEDQLLESYNWTLETQSIGNDPIVGYDFTGTPTGDFMLCLSVTNLAGCSDSSCLSIEFKEDFAFYVPNTFSPNADLINDEFYPVTYSDDFEFFEMIIVNRWGTVFFKSNDLSNSIWDGTLYGQPVQQDVYIWKITYRLAGEINSIEKTGHVSLLR